MHVLPAKHSFGKCDRKVTDGQTDDGQSDPYVSLCFAGDTKQTLFMQIFGLVALIEHKKNVIVFFLLEKGP